jgi:uncharacterized membrane protein
LSEGCRCLSLTKVLAIISMMALAALIQVSPPRAYGFTVGNALIPGLVAKPGNRVHFLIQLNYTATQPISSVTYFLSTKGLPAGWIAKYNYSGQEITSLTVMNKMLPELLDLEVDIPKNAMVGHYTFYALAVGNANYESIMLELTLDVVAPRREIKLSTLYPDVTIEGGGTAKFTLVLDNVGDTDELANLTSAFPQGWSLTFKGQAGGIFGVYVPQGQSTIIDVEAKPPEGVAAGIYDINVTAQSADGVANSTLPLRVDVVKVGTTEKILSTLYPEMNVEGVSAVFFPLTIKNLGTGSLTYQLSQLSIPPGWTASFRTGPDKTSSSVSSIFLDGGESAILYLDAEPPATVVLGTYAFSIRAISEEGATQDLTVTARLIGSYEVTLDLNILYSQIRAGETSTVLATVTNTGASKLMNVSLEILAPSNWEVTKTPNYIDSLNPGDFSTITMFLKAPSSADVGDYLIGVRATSDRARSSQILLRVNVQSQSVTLWVIGIAAIVIAIIAIVLVYMKFGRRR